MRHVLRRHPDTPGFAAAHIDVEIACPRDGCLVLSYIVTGRIGDVRWPPEGAATRSDGLWRHTCFEAFIRPAPDDAYYEFNFSPSTQWAAYLFDGYRNGMRVADVSAPLIRVYPGPDRYTLQATLESDFLSGLPRESAWRLGLSAVIEETGGLTSYWALAHPSGKPDFHHSDGFAHEFFPAVRP